MRNRIILLISLLLQIACGQSDKQTEDLQKYELKGNVKSIEYATYKAVEESGRIVAGKELSYEGTKKILFDKKGNVTEIATSEPLPNRFLNTKTTYIYEGDKLVREDYEEYYTDHRPKDKRMSYIYEYDNKGHKSKKKIILPNGSTRDEIIYKYNSKGQLIRTEENIAGEYLVFSEKNYQYDEKGNLIVLGADDKNFNEFFKYNENNQLIEHRTPIISEEYSSDPIPDIKVGERIEYSEYDSKGNLIGKRNTTTKLEDKWIEVSYSRYESDSKGNWVKRIYFQDATPKSVTIRTIEYY